MKNRNRKLQKRKLRATLTSLNLSLNQDRSQEQVLLHLHRHHRNQDLKQEVNRTPNRVNARFETDLARVVAAAEIQGRAAEGERKERVDRT